MDKPRPAALACALACVGFAAQPAGIAPAANALAGEASQHLRDYAEHPIDWVPWGPAAFETAKEQKKMLFVSIGYRACPWSRRMDEESFSDAATAAQLNRLFVCVKVDRQQRPDLDLAFRLYAQATGNNAGWPLNVWLTASGNPVSVGSYFPPEADASSPSFGSVFKHIATQWERFPKYVEEQSVRDLAKLDAKLARKPIAELEAPARNAVAKDFYAGLSSTFDPTYGGFDASVKFPRPEVLQGLAALAAAEPPGSFRRSQMVKMLERSLDGMLAGAIIDPLDGGVFRYANDTRWRTPQFEKMLIDQARFALAAIAAFEITGNDAHAAAARRALAFADASLRAPDGTFYTSLADETSGLESGGGGKRRGGYYLWDAGELRSLLTAPEAEAFFAAFGIRDGGNITSTAKLIGIPASANIPYGNQPGARSPLPGSPLASAVAKVSAARAARPQPPRNEMVITGANAVMASAFARTGEALQEQPMIDRAKALAQQLTAKLFDPATGQLSHASAAGKALPGSYCEDYIFMARALIDIHRASSDPSALAAAADFQRLADERFFDPKVGLYHLTPTDQMAALPFHLWVIGDSDAPSANGVAARNLLDLAELRAEPALAERAARVLRAMSPELSSQPVVCPSAVLALLSEPAPGSKE